jgi:hypothetical protein
MGKDFSLVICLQNDAELRSTGGFITKVIFIRSSFLRVSADFLNVFEDFEKSDVSLPEIFKVNLGYSTDMRMQFRDANMDLDDEVNFLNMQKIFKLNFGTIVSKFVLVNYSFIECLFKLYGPLKFNDLIWDHHNLFRRVTQSTSDINRHNLDDLSTRKNILTDLLKVLIGKIVLKFYKLPWLLYEFKKAVDEKCVQILGGNSMNFIGPIYRENNLLGLKNNRYVSRKLDIMTEITEKEIIRTYVFSWYHPGEENWPISGIYNAVLKFKPEENYKVLSAVVIPNRWQKDLFFNIKLKPKESQSVVIRTMKKIKEVPSKYRICYHKQSGLNDNFTETVSCPKNYDIVDGVDNVYFYKSFPDSNVSEEIQIIKNDYPPRITQHEVINKNKILISFNEKVFESEYFNLELISNKKNKSYSIDYEWINSNTELLIIVNDWSPQEEDFFNILLKGVYNKNNVLISPNERLLTVVYRSKYFII